jgi:asparagine synthase (glutamine-hydrolysing)
MCGILGHLPACDHGAFQSALDRIRHRGPDGDHIWHAEDGGVTLGHRRLAILDLSVNGRQPMEWGGRYVITFNGEIYNYVELKTDLEKKGVQFRTHSDTEVLLALFAAEGENCLSRLNGMWALAIYDKVERTLFLSRDRMGKKPLFYLHQGDKLIFASEMKALYPFLGQLSLNAELVEKAKQNVFCYESGEECLVQGIKRFPAASYGWYRNGRLSVTKFWEPLDHLTRVPRSYPEQVEQFRELFIDACKIRMRSDVPVGTALSGGVDSSATISTMAYVARHLEGVYSRDWQHAFVASFPGSSIDETKEAKKVVDNLGIGATYLSIDPLKDIDKLFYYTYLFEDLYLTSPIPFIQLYGGVKANGTTVTLDGHGSDELFGGYPFDLAPKMQDDFPDIFRIRETLQTMADGRGEDRRVSWGQVYLQVKNTTRQRWKRQAGMPARDPRLDHLNAGLYSSSFKTILPTLLRNYDRYSMINGVEIRMPFLDHRLISFAFSIPGSSKVRNGYTKAIVRDAMKGFFPDDIRLLKRKIGFNSPFTEWLKGPLRSWVRDIMADRTFNEAQFIDAASVRTKIESVITNETASYTDGEQAWIALMPYIWEKSFIHAK